MAKTQNLVIFSLVVILAATMFNTNILVSGVEHENKIKYTYCAKTLCSDSYLPHMCFFDCTTKGFETGTCIVPTPNTPLRCCCGTL
uniref:Defensin-like domain-containing protein n=1 Tax=Brassica oleracea var. oleracea TaxID=109376 RepID=A0A0D3C930_BRAOL